MEKLNNRLPRVLASGYHYCDTTDNPFFVECKQGITKERGQGCRKHPVYLMNVSRGMQQLPAVPADKCGAETHAGCGKYELPEEHISEGVRTHDTLSKSAHDKMLKKK